MQQEWHHRDCDIRATVTSLQSHVVTWQYQQPNSLLNFNCLLRSGENTHISMISNSVTHLRSYTNTAIANIVGNSAPSVDIECQCCRIKCRYSGIERRVFHDVLRLFHDVLLVIYNVLHMFHYVLHVFHDILQVFHNVLRCLASHTTIGIGACTISNRCIGNRATANNCRDWQ